MTKSYIPDRLYFRIGEVCAITDIKPHVLRYWETEFPQIHPSKTSGGLRLYSRKDIELVTKIKQLLYREGYTIAGAKKALATHKLLENPPDKNKVLKDTLTELKAIREILS